MDQRADFMSNTHLSGQIEWRLNLKVKGTCMQAKVKCNAKDTVKWSDRMLGSSRLFEH